MKIEIADDGVQTAIDIAVGHALLMGTVLDFMCEYGVLNRERLVARIAHRAMHLTDGLLLPFETVRTALDDGPSRPERGAKPRLHLVER